jgi:hypothetical protein
MQSVIQDDELLREADGLGLWLNVLADDVWLDSVERKRERRVVTSREKQMVEQEGFTSLV